MAASVCVCVRVLDVLLERRSEEGSSKGFEQAWWGSVGCKSMCVRCRLW